MVMLFVILLHIYTNICKYPSEKYLNTSIEKNNINPTQKDCSNSEQVYFVS